MGSSFSLTLSFVEAWHLSFLYSKLAFFRIKSQHLVQVSMPEQDPIFQCLFIIALANILMSMGGMYNERKCASFPATPIPSNYQAVTVFHVCWQACG